MSWEISRLGTHIEVLSGFAFDSKKFSTSSGIPLIRIRDIKRSYTETFYNGEFDDKYVIKSGDVLIGMDGEFNIAEWSGVNALLNQRVCKVFIKQGSQLDLKYLLYFLPYQLKLIEDKASFVTVKHLSVNDIKNIQIPLPPLATQKRIAEILDAADALRRKDQELLKKYDELAQAIFIDMFGDPVRNEKGWVNLTFKEFAKFENGDRSSNYPTQKDFVKDGIPFYGTQNMSNGILNDVDLRFISEEKFKTLSRGKLRTMDLVITLRGSIGNCVLFSSEKFSTGFINAQMMIIRVNDNLVLPDFLQFAFTMESFQRRMKESVGGSAVPQITAAQVKDFSIIIPPLGIQMSFVSLIKEINKIKNFEIRIYSESLFHTLIHKAFKGELVA